MKELHDAIREAHRPLVEKIDLLNHLLTGNGDPSKGLILRVDRLEQAESRRTWVVRSIFMSSLTAALAAAAAFLKK